MRHPTGKRFVGSLETANTEQRNHTHVFRDFQQSFDLVFFKAFHWSGVITKCLRCPHHSGKRDHDMAIDPEIETRLHSSSFARRPAENPVTAPRTFAFCSSVKPCCLAIFSTSSRSPSFQPCESPHATITALASSTL